jgi:general secretion pathway protein E
LPIELIDFLTARGRLDSVHRDRVLALRRERGESESVIITRLGMIDERDMARHLSEFLKIPLARPEDFPAAPLPLKEITADFLSRARALPLRETPEGLVLAMADPTDDYTIKAVRLAAGKPVLPWAAVPSEVTSAIAQLYEGGTVINMTARSATRVTQAAADDLKRLSDLASEEPVIRYVNWLIGEAVAKQASDIHIESAADRVVQRFRIDGLLLDMPPPPAELHDRIVSRIKIMAALNIAERRLPQDGRFRMAIEGRQIDLRISIVPTLHGESVVMRLLDRARAPLDLQGLGFGDHLRDMLTKLLEMPSGMILVTGPTGSGKTSTLYAALQHLNTRDRKILTVEDPVEYELPGINQIPVRPAIGLNFANVLRSLLRQDPDVLLVGEIRDLETARISAQASLTGHLLLSTLHTNDAASAVTRLLDMGLEDYVLASVLRAVMAQRLVRRLCPACRQPYEPPATLRGNPEFAVLAERPTLYRPGGCAECNGSGYRGRSAIAELIVFDDHLKSLVLARADLPTVIREAKARGMVDLRSDGIAKAAAGITSLEEVFRVTGTA